jgi:hypothetical protein
MNDLWQPIATAPQDGTVILFCERVKFHHRGTYTQAEHYTVSTCVWNAHFNEWELCHSGIHSEDDSCDPEFWMPCPKPYAAVS